MAGENCPFGPARVRGKIFRLLTKFFPFQNRKNFARGVRSVRIAYPPCKWPPSSILIVDKFRRKWPSACTPGFRSVVLWPVSRGLQNAGLWDCPLLLASAMPYLHEVLYMN